MRGAENDWKTSGHERVRQSHYRPYVWGLGAFGQQGVDKVIELILDEFRMTMRQTRTTAIDQIVPSFVMEGRTPIMMRSNNLGFGL